MAVASVFLFHGAGNVLTLQNSAETLELSIAVVFMVGIAELLAAVALLVGPFSNSLVTRFGALMMILILLSAIVMVHWGRRSFTPAEGFRMGGMEFQVVLMLIAGYFLFKGNKV